MSEAERFWVKVDKSDECWLWTAAKRGRGYGCFMYRGHLTDAHRVAYILTKGEIPADSVVMHSCDNPACVNPEHLSIGSWQANTRDAMQKQRHSMPPGSGKLNPDIVHKIRRLYATGAYSYRRLAHLYGIDYKTVYQIIKGEIWKDMPTTIDHQSDHQSGDIDRQMAA